MYNNELTAKTVEFPSNDKHSCQMPVETWLAILAWIKRMELAERVGYTNRFLGVIGQTMLHEEGEIEMRRLRFKKNKESAEILVCEKSSDPNRWWYSIDNPWIWLPIPTTHVPENFKKYANLHIKNLNETMIEFLRHIQPILQSVQLCINIWSNNLEFSESHLMREFVGILFGRTNELTCNERDFDHFYAIYTDFMQNIPKLILRYLPDNRENLIHWLHSPIEGDKIRKLDVGYYLPEYNAFIEGLKQEFLSAKKPAAYKIEFFIEEFEPNLMQFNVQNELTGEMLLLFETHSFLHFYRQPDPAKDEELMAKMKENEEKSEIDGGGFMNLEI